jgi:hypothetical protein
MLTEWKDLSREVNVQHVEAISEETKCERKGKNSGGLGQTRHCNCRKKRISYKKEQGAQQIE